MKSIRIAALLVGFVFLAVSASAGELAYQPGGMWMPQQIADVHADTLRKMGLKFDPQNFGDMLAFPLNAAGEFAGIVFDSNIEGVGSDLVFQPGVTRAIHADVRYFEWLLDAVDGGGYLLREMGVTPVFCE